VVVVKGIGMARVETAWGLYLFTACVLTSILIGHLSGKRRREESPQGLEERRRNGQ
jgi:hypothetical protein